MVPMSVWFGFVFAGALLLTGCEGDGGSNGAATDTLAELLPPPEATRAACEAAGWEWYRDDSWPYCPPDWECERLDYCYCLLPCETDADCAPYTTRYCTELYMYQGSDATNCTTRRFCHTEQLHWECQGPESESKGTCE